MHPVIFTNKKSKELFECDLMNGEQEENFKKINEPCFIKISAQDGLNSYVSNEPVSYATKARLNRAHKKLLSLQ